MSLVSRLVRTLFPGRKAELPAEDPEKLRAEFKARYHGFKLLLAANNAALEVMAEIEEALAGGRTFDMVFVRSRCVKVSTQVFQMIKCLAELAPGKYDKLFDKLAGMRKAVEPNLRPPGVGSRAALVVDLKDIDEVLEPETGPKMANLVRASRLGAKTPDGFVVTAGAYARFMEHEGLGREIERRLQVARAGQLDELYALSSDIQQLVISAPLPEDLAQAITRAAERLAGGGPAPTTVAVRSSALGEDTANSSFAGQYRSELNVGLDNLLAVYKEIVASKYGVPAMSYRFSRGLRDDDVAMCVGVLRMVRAGSSGVLYTADPLGEMPDAMPANSAWGLPASVVDGSLPTDTFAISRTPPHEIVSSDLAEKPVKLVCLAEEGVRREPVDRARWNEPSLDPEQAARLAAMGLAMEKHWGRPLDIEWTFDSGNELVLLQCRPLLGPKGRADAHGTGGKEADAPVLTRGGSTACPGAGAGVVHQVRKDMDILAFPKGGVLVAAMARPRLAALLSRASAVVTERGGVASHLANVAREFGVPALFGVRDAMERMPHGEAATVDADARIVYKGLIPELLTERPKPADLMRGSPVHQALDTAAKHIVPLTLLDPDAASFSPDNARTMHDITRFCHEKAVQEMFHFGRDHGFPERASKQLVYKVRMQWWVLNLDDGFQHEVEGKYVRLEEIACRPMLALWDGMVAVPWQGPPGVDGRGLLSVMFRATANPQLVPGRQSSYSNRNYFMISKNYMSLHSRFGFHYSIIEALVSKRTSENYLSFQFKGGAADEARRTRRVKFIRDILEELDFQVKVREDHLRARVKNRGQGYMKSRIKALGYLLMHTRQLDMVMLNQAAVAHQGERMRRDLAAVMGESPAESDTISERKGLT